MTIVNATRTQKVDFIYKNFKFKGGMTKKRLNNYSDKALDDFIDKYQDDFKLWLSAPKKTKYFVEGRQDGKDLLWKCEAISEESLRKELEDDGVEITRMVPQKGHHVCKYCGGIADGTQTDILCSECRTTFGHYSYYEL